MRTPGRALLPVAALAFSLLCGLPASASANPGDHVPVPPEARAVDTSHPDHVIGNGRPASCTSAKVVAAVAKGGLIRFNCGPSPVTIHMTAPARVFNDKPDVVIDGRGKVTLDGGGTHRIIYMNTCDPDLVWTTDHCQNQAHPTLTVQNITLRNGRSYGRETEDGGGAIFDRGGRLKIVTSASSTTAARPPAPTSAAQRSRRSSSSTGGRCMWSAAPSAVRGTRPTSAPTAARSPASACRGRS